MAGWDARFQVMGPDAAFPQFHNCTVDSRRDLSYRCEGRMRRDETCLFDLTLEGSGVFSDAQGEHVLTPGKAFVCVLNDPATAYYYPPGASERWSFLWITFSGGGVAQMVKALLSRHGAVCEISLKSPFARRLLSLEEYAGAIASLPPAESAKMVMELLASVEEAMLSKAAPDAADDLLVEKIQREALSEGGLSIGVAGLAKALGVSREHISRVFRRRVGQSLSDWLQGRRAALAAKLLKDESLSCKEAAWRLGYSSQANFTRAFRKSTGMSPAKFKASGAWLPF